MEIVWILLSVIFGMLTLILLFVWYPFKIPYRKWLMNWMKN